MGTVVIGVGGVGKVVLMKLRRMIVEEYGELKDDICFLHVDTFNDAGQEGGQDFSTRTLGTDITLRRETERLILSDNLPPQASRLTDHPYVKEWFPPTLPCNVNLSQGAGGVRAYGRLAFHHNIFSFKQKLNQMVTRAAQKNASVDIYVVCSLFGGTGSGSFLDLCYLAKDEKKAYEGEVVGFFIIGASNPDAGMKENCYAALAELEYYMTGPLLKDRKKNKPFEAHYPVNGVAEVISDEAPVDTCYLFGINNGARMLDRSGLEEMVAKRVFFEIVPGIKDPMAGKRVDIKATQGYYMPDRLLKRNRTFFGTGCSAIEFPAPRLMNAFGSAFGAYCCDHLLYKNAVGFGDLKKEITEFIEDKLDVSLRENDLKKVLEKLGTTTISSSMKEDRFKWWSDLKEKIEKSAVKERTIHSDAEKTVTSAINSINEKGTYALTVRNNMEKLWDGTGENKGIRNTIGYIIGSYISDKDKGPDKAIDFIDSLLNQLKNDQKRLNDTCTSADNGLRSSREEVDRRLKKIKLDEIYQEEVKKHIEWLCNKELVIFMEKGIKKVVYEAMNTLFYRIITEIEAQKNLIVQYKKGLSKIKDAFITEAKEVSINLAEWLTAESQDGNTFLDNLDKCLKQLININNLNNFSSIVELLSKSYHINDPFDGKIEAKAVQVITQMGNPLISLRENPDEFKKRLFMECRGLFSMLGSVSICDLLISTLSDQARASLLNQKINLSQWFLNVFTNDPTLDHDPATHEKKWVCVPNDINLQNHLIWNGALGQYNASTQRSNAIKEDYRLVFATEIGVFSLRSIMFLDDYKKIYRRLSPQERENRHTNTQIDYLDPMPEDPKLTDIHTRAEQAELIGKIMGFLKEETDPETHYQAIYLYHSDPVTGVKMNDKICRQWESVVETLRGSQVKKDIEKQSSKDTHLEILEGEIDRLAKSKRTKEEKEDLCKMIQSYLNESLKQLQGDDQDKKRHPLYQKNLRITDEFFKKYQLYVPGQNA